jgi:predicted XRE-type DNA-binding protein
MTEKLKITRGSGNVFRDVGFTPGEAENLLLRSELMSRIRDTVKGTTQREAAKLFGVTQPRINDLLRGRIEKFSLDALVNMLGKAGMRRVRACDRPPDTRVPPARQQHRHRSAVVYAIACGATTGNDCRFALQSSVIVESHLLESLPCGRGRNRMGIPLALGQWKPS